MPSADSVSAENCAMISEIFRGCSPSEVNNLALSSGLRRINFQGGGDDGKLVVHIMAQTGKFLVQFTDLRNA